MQFTQLFQSYIEKTRDLAELLDREYQALRADDQAVITELSEHKQVLLEQCQKDEKILVSFLQQNHTSSISSHLGDYIPKLPEIFGENIKPLSSELLKIAVQCKKQNMINGAIISSRINSLRKALDILRYGSEQQAVSYTAQGDLVSQLKDSA